MTVDELLAQLDAIFSPLIASRQDGITREYSQQLRAYEGDTLQRAYREVLDDWTKTVRPMPAEFRKACLRIAPSPAIKQAEDHGGAIAYRRLVAMRREIRGTIERTFEWLGDEIAVRAVSLNVQPRHLSGCVAHRIEQQAWASWARDGKMGPQVHELTENDWASIIDHALTRQRCDDKQSRYGSFVSPRAAVDGEGNRHRDSTPNSERPVAREILEPEATPSTPTATPLAENQESPSGEPEIAKFVESDEIEAF